MGDKALVGLRDGTIYRLDLSNSSKKTVMESHSDGEVWGLSLIKDTHVITSGDDNKLKVWDISSRRCEQTAIISSIKRQAPLGGASSLSTLPASQCSRAISYNLQNGHIAVGHNDGTLTIRESV